VIFDGINVGAKMRSQHSQSVSHVERHQPIVVAGEGHIGRWLATSGGWVELAILHTLVPHLAKWLVTGAASALTDPGALAGGALTGATAVAVLSSHTVLLLAIASRLVLRRDVA
jgi:hypothetical protein